MVEGTRLPADVEARDAKKSETGRVNGGTRSVEKAHEPGNIDWQPLIRCVLQNSIKRRSRKEKAAPPLLLFRYRPKLDDG